MILMSIENLQMFRLQYFQSVPEDEKIAFSIKHVFIFKKIAIFTNFR